MKKSAVSARIVGGYHDEHMRIQRLAKFVQENPKSVLPDFWQRDAEFNPPSSYGDVILKPVRRIREAEIIREWDECQRIFVSLALKETTQSTVVRKLSSQARNSRTKRALWEYDGIHRSLYLLDYINSLTVRKNVQKAVNRGENYHQLRRAVSFARFGKPRFKTEYEQDLWSECSRLIANSIIFYNASILSRFLEHQETNGDTQGADATKKVSPIAWQNTNLHGRYEFQKQPDLLNVDVIIHELLQRPQGALLHTRRDAQLYLSGAMGKNLYSFSTQTPGASFSPP